jgi:predicted ribosome quality control (RQC) complex YloA/Tae2 family protein
MRRDLKKARRLLANLDKDLESARRADEFRHIGNLLVTWRHKMRKGMTEITVTDFSGTAEVTIPLEAALDPDANTRLYFRRAKKGEKGIEIITARRARIREDIKELEKKIADTEAIADPAVLAGMIIQDEVGSSGKDGKKERNPLRFKSFPIDDRHTILVGRNDRENDELTHRYAAPTDLWFHAQGSPGSHVVLRGANRSTPARIIEIAAEVAAWFSKARGSVTVPVIFTEKRYVRRPRGAKPGTAVCQRSKTLFVTPRIPED